MVNEKYYKLGAKASSFSDPTQPEEDNKKLALGQVKKLAQTQNVSERIKAGGLVLVEKEEYDDYQKNLKASQKTKINSDSKSLKDANKKTVDALNAQNKAELELKKIKEESASILSESKAKDEELKELRAKVEASKSK